MESYSGHGGGRHGFASRAISRGRRWYARVIVRLPKGISIGQTQTINYQAVLTPSGWLTDWMTQKVEFPKVLVEGATSDSGAIAAQTVDDLVVRPDVLSGLTPLLDNEKATFGLGNIPTALAYRFAGRDFAAGLVVERTAPSIAAQVYSFLKFERDNLVVHYELNYDVREARTRLVAFSLPIDTPVELAIRGLESTVVKETSSRDRRGPTPLDRTTRGAANRSRPALDRLYAATAGHFAAELPPAAGPGGRRGISVAACCGRRAMRNRISA